MKAKALIAARVGLLLFLAVAAWRAMNYRSKYEPGPDSSIFMSIGWHVHNGRVLYKEELSGPPMIYALDGAALAMGGDGVNSVRAMERGFAVIGVVAFFAATFLAFGRFWLAWLSSALFLIHMFRVNVIEDGNVTEEYGSVLIVLGIAFGITASKWTGRKRFVAGMASGAAFSLAVLCKEPFVLIVPPWFLFAAWPRNGNWADARNRALAFLIGAAAPVLAFVGYLVAHSAFVAWIDTIAVSLAYTAAGPAPDGRWFLVRLILKMNDSVEPMLVASVTAILGLGALFRRSWLRSRDGLPLVITASVAMSLLATALGGRYFGHYYMFFVPSFVLLCACGIDAIADSVSRSRRWTGAAMAAGFVLLTPATKDLRTFAGNLTVPAERWQGHWLSELIRRNTTPDDQIWTPWKPLLYVETRRLAPTKWQSVFDIYFVDTPGSSTEQKYKALRDELNAHPPRAIVISPLPGFGPTRRAADEFLLRSGLTSWIAANYQSVMCSSEGNHDLLLLKGPRPATGLTPLTSDSVAMQTGLGALYYADDPVQAIACFRQVLARNPAHYGAHFQLAKALDGAGRIAEATTQWRYVLGLARQWKDAGAEAQALKRLQSTTP